MFHHLMWFHWDTNVGEFLFPGLNVNGTLAVILLCLLLATLSVIYEGVKVIQTQSKARAARERLRTASCQASETTNLLTSNRQNQQHAVSMSTKILKFFGQLSIFLFHNIIGYLLMLSVMVYNINVFIAVVFGMGLGYFLFGHISMKINMENIRARTMNVVCTNKSSAGVLTSSIENTPNQLKYSANSSTSSSSTGSTGPIYTSVLNETADVDIHPQNQNQDSNVLHSCRL